MPDIVTTSELVRALLRKRGFARALEVLHEALASVPETAAVYRMFGIVCSQAGDLAAGARLLGDGVRLHPGDPLLHLMLGGFLLELRRFDEAAPVLSRALDLDPQNAPAALELTGALFALRRWPEALAAGQHAIGLGVESPDHLAALAYACSQIGQAGQAAAYLRRALEIDPGRTDLLLAFPPPA